MAIRRDTGASFPVNASATGTVTSVTTAAFSTNGPCLLIARYAACNVAGTNQSPYGVAWVGSIPAGATPWKLWTGAQNTGNNDFAGIFYSVCTQALTTVQVIGSANVSSLQAAQALSVDAVTGANPNVTVWDAASVQSGSMTAQRTLSVSSESWLLVAAAGETVAALTPATNTTEHLEALDASGGVAGTGTNTTGTAGSIAVGWTETFSFGAVAAVELEAVLSDGADSVGAYDTYAVYGPAGAAKAAFQPSAFQATGFQPAGPDGGAPPANRDLSETATPADAYTSQAAQVSALSESATPSDASTGALRIPAALSEAATPSDASTGVLRIPRTLSESASPSDALSAVMRYAGSLSEAATAADAYDSDLTPGGGPPIGVLSESVNAADALSATQRHASSLAEACTAADAYAAVIVRGVSLAETATPADAYASRQIHRSALSESVSPTDAYERSGSVPVVPSGPSNWRPYLFRIGKQRPWFARHYQRRMRGHS